MQINEVFKIFWKIHRMEQGNIRMAFEESTLHISLDKQLN